MNNYFVTHGRGIDSFVLNEFKQLDKLELVDSVEGKIFFKTEANLAQLLRLKTVERLFLDILHIKFGDIGPNENYLISSINEKFNLDINSNLFKEIIQNLSSKHDEFTENEAKKFCKPLKFRVNCKLTGKWRKNEKFRSCLIELISQSVKSVNSHFEIDLKEPNFEIACHLSELCLAIGLPVSKSPISSRSYIKNVGLRSTICAVMLQLASIKPNSLVLDPFCGKSTIFAEHFDCKNIFYIGSDSNLDQLIASSSNLSSQNSFNLIQTNIRDEYGRYPFRSGLFDYVVSDLPFGIQHKKEFFKSENDAFYESILIEFDRLLTKPGSVAVVLVNSNERLVFEEKLNSLHKSNKVSLELVEKHVVSLGETSACLFKLKN
jgi:23S rRNA G2445 N2-methylase RlmL